MSTSAAFARRDTRQIAGLIAASLIALFVLLALGATIAKGWQGDWLSSWDVITRVTGFTLWQAFLSTFLSIALAIPVALALDNLPTFKGRSLVMLLFTIPLALPVIVVILALLTLLGRNGLLSQFALALGINWKPDIYGLTGILLAHVFFNMPLAVRIMVQRMDAIPQEQWKLAESLRFTMWNRLRWILGPKLLEILPGLASLVFLLCLGSYAIILVLGGGPQATTLQVAIYQALSLDFDVARASILTLVQLGLTLLVLSVLPRMKLVPVQTTTGATKRYHQTTKLNRTMSLALITLGAACVALPLAATVFSGIKVNHGRLLSDPLLWQALTTSVVIATLSAIVATVASWALSAASHSYSKRPASIGAKLVAQVPFAVLAIPSLVLGVGWFLFAIKTGIPLTIVPLLVVLANALLALPFVMQVLQPRLHDTFNSYDRLAQSLGMTRFSRLWLVNLAVMRPALITAVLFAFALSLGDLGVVTLFGTDQLLTLPALIFQKMGSYRNNDAAGLALYLALLTGLLSYLAMKADRHDRA